VLKKIFGSRNDRLIRQMSKRVKKINALEEEIQKLSDEQLKAKTEQFRASIEDGASLDDLLNEAFAVGTVDWRNGVAQWQDFGNAHR